MSAYKHTIPYQRKTNFPANISNFTAYFWCKKVDLFALKC